MSDNFVQDVREKMKEENVEFDCSNEVLVSEIFDHIIWSTIDGLCEYHCNNRDSGNINYWPCIDGVRFSLQEHPYEEHMYSICMSDAGRRSTTSDELLECISNAYKSYNNDNFDGEIDTYKIRVILTSLFDCAIASKATIYKEGAKEPVLLLKYMDDLDKEYIKSFYAESAM